MVYLPSLFDIIFKNSTSPSPWIQLERSLLIPLNAKYSVILAVNLIFILSCQFKSLAILYPYYFILTSNCEQLKFWVVIYGEERILTHLQTRDFSPCKRIPNLYLSLGGASYDIIVIYPFHTWVRMSYWVWC